MERRWFTLGLGLSAIGLQTAALVSLVQWFRHTDWLFGHYQGPASLVLTARVCAALGLGASVLWLIAGWRSARVHVGIALLLLFLALPSTLILLGWAAEATRPLRNSWDEPRNYWKPDPEGQKPASEQQPGSARTKMPG
jgi:hypothetical protein